jgi:hypothetical protein
MLRLAVPPASFLELARRLRDSEHEDDPGALTDLEEAPAIAAREQIGAVLLRSPQYGEVWVVLEGSLLGELRAEEQERPDPRAVLRTDQILRLRGKSEAAIRAVLNTLAAFPEAEICA